MWVIGDRFGLGSAVRGQDSKIKWIYISCYRRWFYEPIPGTGKVSNSKRSAHSYPQSQHVSKAKKIKNKKSTWTIGLLSGFQPRVYLPLEYFVRTQVLASFGFWPLFVRIGTRLFCEISNFLSGSGSGCFRYRPGSSVPTTPYNLSLDSTNAVGCVKE